MKIKKKKETKKPVFMPFENPYENNIFLDSDSICSENFSEDIGSLDLEGLKEREETLIENIMEWEDIIYDDMTRYSNGYYKDETAKADLQSDRRMLQTIKVELREVRNRIKMMMNNSRERGLSAA